MVIPATFVSLLIKMTSKNKNSPSAVKLEVAISLDIFKLLCALGRWAVLRLTYAF